MHIYIYTLVIYTYIYTVVATSTCSGRAPPKAASRFPVRGSACPIRRAKKWGIPEI